ncbi:hypothetical protein V1525DRAFT_434688 [Lipomyces kononenkoae]|uniref:Uncharacterized protein n=1 Tax=Lipomyces kononenkoae TaxID=34357 RepID=A0ACC3SXC0_LIPKO
MPSTASAEYAPRSIAQLSATADEYDFDPAVHLRYWIRSASAILRQARVYDDEDVYDDAYILYLRYAQLVLNRLHTHPEAKKAPERTQLVSLSKKLAPILSRLQELKPIIEKSNAEYEESQRRLAHRRAELAKLRKSTETEEAHNKSRDEVDRADDTLDMRGLGAADHPELLVLNQQAQLPIAREMESDIAVHNQYAYPSLPSRDIASLPSIPTILPPEKPQKLPYSAELPEVVVRPNKSIEHKPIAATEGGTPLRTVFLPSELRSSFLEVALPNTRKNLETCGILCGVLNRNAFFITDLVIPEQDSTSDTCATKDEEGLFNFLDENDLFQLGWIHTHPTQTCFLSSVDLHTQNSYQLMLTESIAIVCAPMHEPSWGIFRLTDPHGIKAITSCRQPGLFHPHSEKNIYTNAKRPPGHVFIRDGLPFKIVDLRNK